MVQHNKEHLQKLLEFLKKEIIHEYDNKWFVDELRNAIESQDKRSMVDANALLDIREQCIEDILKEQATGFYKDFVIEELKVQLIRDFVKMEMWHRRNNIQEFCLALYQQIECVVNYIASKDIVDRVASKLMSAPAYIGTKEDSKKEASISDRDYRSSFRIANLLFMKDAISKAKTEIISQKANDKFRTIFYFICKQAKLKNAQYDEFRRETDIFRDIYSMRNQNHRGNNRSYWDSKVDERVKNQTTLYYFKFLDFLATFIQGVNNGYPISPELQRFAETFEPTQIPVQGPKVLGKINLPKDERNRFK